MRVLELFCGIGSVATAVRGRHNVVCAVDHDRQVLTTYGANHDHPQWVMNLDHVRAHRLSKHGANLWWMSPPCKPYTVRGKRLDLDDPRARSLKHLIGLVDELRPRAIALENVRGFDGSRAQELLRGTLDGAGYSWWDGMLCPTELGTPMERRRYFLVASLDGLSEPHGAAKTTTTLADFLDAQPDPSLDASAELLERYGPKLHVVRADDPKAIAATFTAAYGRSPVYAGSYLRQDGRLRRFSPTEIARLMGLGDGFRFAPGAPLARRYQQVGNAVHVGCVRRLLSRLPNPQGAATSGS